MIKNIQSVEEERDTLLSRCIDFTKAAGNYNFGYHRGESEKLLSRSQVMLQSHRLPLRGTHQTEGGSSETRFCAKHFIFAHSVGRQTCSRLKTHVVMSQRVESLPASFLLGGQVQVGQDLTRGAGTPLCGRTTEPTLDSSALDLCLLLLGLDDIFGFNYLYI